MNATTMQAQSATKDKPGFNPSPSHCQVFVKLGSKLRVNVTENNAPDFALYDEKKFCEVVFEGRMKVVGTSIISPEYSLIHVYPLATEDKFGHFPNARDIEVFLLGGKSLVVANADPKTGRLQDGIILRKDKSEGRPTRLSWKDRNAFACTEYGTCTPVQVLEKLSKEYGFRYRYVTFNRT